MGAEALVDIILQHFPLFSTLLSFSTEVKKRTNHTISSYGIQSICHFRRPFITTVTTASFTMSETENPIT
jgi:hypothetical protein